MSCLCDRQIRILPTSKNLEEWECWEPDKTQQPAVLESAPKVTDNNFNKHFFLNCDKKRKASIWAPWDSFFVTGLLSFLGTGKIIIEDLLLTIKMYVFFQGSEEEGKEAKTEGG